MLITLPPVLLQWLGTIVTRHRAARRRAADRAALAAMNGRELADLGLGRDQVDRILHAPARRAAAAALDECHRLAAQTPTKLETGRPPRGWRP